METQYVVITGDPLLGFNFIGPFDSLEDADSWAENKLGGDWWLTHLENPEDQSAED